MKYWNDEMMKSLEWMPSNIPIFHNSIIPGLFFAFGTAIELAD